MTACLASRASLLRAACKVHSCRRRSIALCLRLHLLERSALVGGVAFGDAPLFAARFELSRQLLNVPGQRRGFHFSLGEVLFQTRQPGVDLAQLALQRQGTLARRLAARHGSVVKALAAEREEKGVPVFGCHSSALLPNRRRCSHF